MKIINLYNKYVDEEEEHFMVIRINNDIYVFSSETKLGQE